MTSLISMALFIPHCRLFRRTFNTFLKTKLNCAYIGPLHTNFMFNEIILSENYILVKLFNEKFPRD